MAEKKTSPKKPAVSKMAKTDAPAKKSATKSTLKKHEKRQDLKAGKKEHKKTETKTDKKTETKTEKKTEAKTETKKQDTKKIIISIASIIVIIIAAYFVFSYLNSSADSSQVQGVEIGDLVSVNYIGQFTDGEVFDTSYEQTAKDEGIYSETRDYSPLTFTVGAGQMITGFDNAVIGMAVGEKKTVTLSPEDAYGQSDPEKIIDIPTSIDRVIYIEREFEIPSSDFEQIFMKEPVLDSILDTPYFPWNFTVKNIGVPNITLEYLIEIGKPFVLPQTAWNSTAITENETSITVVQNPEPNQVIDTLFGPATITLTETKIIMNIDVEEGQSVTTMYGAGTVVSKGDSFITLDLNSPMVGKSLVFEITLENITKADEENKTISP